MIDQVFEDLSSILQLGKGSPPRGRLLIDDQRHKTKMPNFAVFGDGDVKCSDSRSQSIIELFQFVRKCLNDQFLIDFEEAVVKKMKQLVKEEQRERGGVLLSELDYGLQGKVKDGMERQEGIQQLQGQQERERMIQDQQWQMRDKLKQAWDNKEEDALMNVEQDL